MIPVLMTATASQPLYPLSGADGEIWIGARHGWVSLPGRAARELGDNVELADVARVLLQQVEQDPLQ
jgi:hypothetical protein